MRGPDAPARRLCVLAVPRPATVRGPDAPPPDRACSRCPAPPLCVVPMPRPPTVRARGAPPLTCTTWWALVSSSTSSVRAAQQAATKTTKHQVFRAHSYTCMITSALSLPASENFTGRVTPQKTLTFWAFPGGPVTKTPHSHCRGPGSKRWPGSYILHDATKNPTCRNEDKRPRVLQQRPCAPKQRNIFFEELVLKQILVFPLAHLWGKAAESCWPAPAFSM